jgi:hypothetical protein
MLKAETTRYRRERWETPDGERLIAPLPAGIVGGCGPHLHRLVLMLHFQGQMTCERIVALLAGLGLAISKRQVVRMGDKPADDFCYKAGQVLTRRGEQRVNSARRILRLGEHSPYACAPMADPSKRPHRLLKCGERGRIGRCPVVRSVRERHISCQRELRGGAANGRAVVWRQVPVHFGDH